VRPHLLSEGVERHPVDFFCVGEEFIEVHFVTP
jgi:hypothetical protein